VHAADGSTSVVQTLATEAGAVAIFETNGLERSVRDVLNDFQSSFGQARRGALGSRRSILPRSRPM
jgi:hypothetical protein